MKSAMAGKKAKIVLSDDEEIAEDSSKQGRTISQIDEDLTVSLVQDEGIYWIPQEEEVHEKPSDETEVLVQEETPTEIIEEHGSGEKGEMKISTANIQVTTASPPRLVCCVLCVIQEAQAEEEYDYIFEIKGGYKKSYFKKISYNDIRLIFKRVWDHVNTFIPIGSEVGKDSSKPSERETSKIVEEEKVEEEDENPEPVLIEKKAVGIRRKHLQEEEQVINKVKTAQRDRRKRKKQLIMRKKKMN
ncbi:hypothetical protein Tco_1006649 [Tanacetum coccineum]|uniref:Uncharacterized protein n=1 Tax=Tanacetum coccineum TaxID=301880 RepID=A0ABQ5FIH1_9ASTR